MNNSETYIKPKIKYYSSFKEAKKDSDKDSFLFLDETSEIDYKNFFISKNNFVIAEPGFGKTRLLEEFIKNITGYSKEGICIDLKKIPAGYSIERYIKDYSNEALSLSKKFKLTNQDSVVICLDALDEVKQDRFSEIINSIKSFQKIYPQIYLFISCRWHYFQKYQHLFIDWNFRYFKLYPFSREQTWDYLEAAKFKEKEIIKIIDVINVQQGRNLVIQTPRYLRLLVDYLKEKGVDDFKPILRAELFEYFIYKKLEAEDKKFNTQNRDAIKRVLEKLALIMEIYQTNNIIRDELMTFIDDLDSDLKNILFSRITIEEFFDKTAIKVTDKNIEFDNTEFQEYLAAKEMLRLGNPEQVIFDLTVDGVLKDVYPSWFNTLSFVIDLKIDFIKPILNFVFTNIDKGYVNESYFRLLSNVEVTRLTTDERKEIFEKIFKYHQNVLHWLKWHTAKPLALYFDKSQNDLLKGFCSKKYKNDTERYIQLSNVVQVVDYIVENDLLGSTERDFWKKKLIEYALDKNDNGVLQSNALEALVKFGDDSIIERVEGAWEIQDESIRNSFIRMCEQLNPEHELSIKYFVRGIETDLSAIYARDAIYKIKSSNALKKLLNYFNSNKEFLNEFLHRESIWRDRDISLVSNIEKVWSKDVEKKLRKLILTIYESDKWYEARSSKFVQHIVELLRKKDANYIFAFIKSISESDEIQKHLYGLTEFFQFLIKKNQIKKFVKEVSKLKEGEGKNFGINVLYNIKISNNPQKEAIYRESRKIYTKAFIAREKITKKQLQGIRKKKERNIYSEFLLKLEPTPGQYMTDVFKFFVNNKEVLLDTMIAKDKNRLIKLIVDTVFEKFPDPAETKLKINSRSSGSTNYTTNSNIFVFGDALLAAKELNLNISNEHRKKIINFIPFAYSNHREAIFYLIDDIKSNELKELLKVYKSKTCDKWRHLPESIIDVADHYKLVEAAKILEEFVGVKEFNLYERIRAMEVSSRLIFNKAFLKKIFDKYTKNKSQEKKIADVANALLIGIGEDQNAIKWRFGQITKRAFTFKRITSGVHSVGDKEDELHRREFIKPLENLKDEKFKVYFEQLLIESFKLVKKNSNYYSYAEYIWQSAVNYYKSQRETRSYKPLIELEKFISQYASSEGVNWFGYRIKELRNEYLNYIGKPTDISECIKKYNILKNKRYLKISTSFDLFKMVQEVINKDLSDWIISDGIKMVKGKGETDVQKILKMKIEQLFSKNGFIDSNEIIVLQEPQLLSDKRTDFIISYGFVKPMIIEVKLSVSSDLTGQISKKESYKSMQHYMRAYNSEYGIFLIINNKKNTAKKYNWKNHLVRIERAYNRIDGVRTIGLSLY